MKKNRLFDDQLKLKLEDPSRPLDQWLNIFYSHPVKVEVEKKVSKKKRFQNTKRNYRIRVKDELWPECPEATRSDQDLLMLFKQLELRFPTAIVPPSPQANELGNTSVLAMYLETIANNPFFRTDVAFYDFIDGRLKEYKMTKKKDRKMSEGTIRWLQCCTEYPTVNSDDQFLTAIRDEFNQLDKNYRNVSRTLSFQVDALSRMETANDEMKGSFESLLAMERASELRLPINVSGQPPLVLGNAVENAINMSVRHQDTLKRAYGSSTFKRVLLDPLNFEVAQLAQWKKAVSMISKKKRAYEKAKEVFEKSPADAKKNELEAKKDDKYVEYHKHRQGVLGFELERFRHHRALAFQELYEKLAQFHLTGAAEVSKQWAYSGIAIAPVEEYFEKNLRYANSESGGTSVVQSKHQSLTQSQSPMVDASVMLQVTTSYAPKNRKYLKVTAGEVLAGHKTDKAGVWEATNSQGKKGLVTETYVAIKTKEQRQAHLQYNGTVSQSTSHLPMSGKSIGVSTNNLPRSAPAPPALPPGLDFTQQEVLANKTLIRNKIKSSASLGSNTEAEEAPEEVEQDDWSLSEKDEDEAEDEVAPTTRPISTKLFSIPNISSSLAMPTPTVKKDFGAAAQAPTFNAPTPVTLPVVSSSMPEPPKMPSFNGISAPKRPTEISNQANASTASGFGSPGEKPIIPSFGSPTAEKPTIPTFSPPTSKPKMPTFAGTASMMPKMSLFSRATGAGLKAKTTHVSVAKPNVAAPEVSSSTASPPTMPAGRPPAPALGFLADIKKGPGLKNLKHVPDSEKSVEIGGAVGNPAGPSVVNHGPTPPKAGGGGIMGELSARLNKKK